MVYKRAKKGFWLWLLEVRQRFESCRSRDGETQGPPLALACSAAFGALGACLMPEAVTYHLPHDERCTVHVEQTTLRVKFERICRLASPGIHNAPTPMYDVGFSLNSRVRLRYRGCQACARSCERALHSPVVPRPFARYLDLRKRVA